MAIGWLPRIGLSCYLRMLCYGGQALSGTFMSKQVTIFSLLLPSFLSSAIAVGQQIPPIPPVISVTPMGIVAQNPVIYGRDGAISAEIDGRSVWTFGDTPMSV